MAGNCDSNHIKIVLQNFTEGAIKPVPLEWETFRYGKGYEDVKLFYDGKIINLETVPTFFGEYNYLAGEKLDALIQIQDVALHYVQFKENDVFEIWHYNANSEKYLIIGEGFFKQIIKEKLKIWNTEMFTKRYSKKLEEIPENDGILIDSFDAFANLEFVESIKVNRKAPKNLIDFLLLINKSSLNTSDLNDLLGMIDYISYETTRYKIDFNSRVDNKVLKYQNVQLELASWNSKVFFTIGIRCTSTHN